MSRSPKPPLPTQTLQRLTQSAFYQRSNPLIQSTFYGPNLEFYMEAPDLGVECHMAAPGMLRLPASPPSDEEQWQYYHGLPSRPKLVARSSLDPWQPQRGWWPTCKMLSPVGKHIIADLWNESNGPLRRDIIQALEGVKWTAIDILRIGIDGDSVSDDETDTPEHAITFFISVVPNSTSFQQGFPVVMQCRQILQRHGIDDIHCEMKESDVFRCASETAPQTAPKLLTEAVHPDLTEDHMAMASVYLGASIGPSDRRSRQGTKGLYLLQKDTGAILALTCRHVVFGDTFPNEEYRYQQNEAAPRRTVLQPTDETLEDMKQYVPLKSRVARECIDAIQRTKKSDETKHREIMQHEAALKSFQQWQKILDDLTDPAMRIIGHVIFSPAFGLGKSVSGEPRLRDWALIEIHPGKHEQALDLLHNEIMVNRSGYEKLLGVQSREAPDITVSLGGRIVANNTVRLQGTISEEEMKCPNTWDHTNEPTIMVAKFGATSFLTVGFANTVKSLTRTPLPHLEVISEEWCIIGRKNEKGHGREAFSFEGDSGACVWDVQGRIGGIMAAGGGHRDMGAHDVTYATPIEWLLDDIKGHGFDVELL
ncbi:hypothetical protein QQX98_008569 [Neonectria punicea]|uniref:Uncharacterized protein n=1 Tax=Neonectria punicea TaxID=979145 RepID=A0ABR1GV01_9HYPO